MGRSVGELLETVPQEEIRAWEAYYVINPWGEHREDWRVGQLTALLHNIFKAEDAKSMSAKDFMLYTIQQNLANGEDGSQTVEEQKEMAYFLQSLLGGIITQET